MWDDIIDPHSGIIVSVGRDGLPDGLDFWECLEEISKSPWLSRRSHGHLFG